MGVQSNEAKLNPEVDGSGAVRSRVKTAFRYVRLIVVALLFALIVRSMFVEAYDIPTKSMENTLLVGDYLLADKFTFGIPVPLTEIRLPALRRPRVGDIVVFRFPDNPNKNFIKRVVAVGGDEVQLIDKVLHVNGIPVDETEFAIHTDSTVFPPGSIHPRDNFGPIRVPIGQYFLLGDNRDNSSDSRFWGTVPRDQIFGRAMIVHWSLTPDSEAPAITWWNPISVLGATVYHIYHLPVRVRWNRLFSAID